MLYTLQKKLAEPSRQVRICTDVKGLIPEASHEIFLMNIPETSQLELIYKILRDTSSTQPRDIS